MSVEIKRIYDRIEPGDGYRVLIDHIWPRGVSKHAAQLDEWAKQLAPSGELREWFAHDTERFGEFRARYRRQLEQQPEQLRRLCELADSGTVTILYAARDREHNNAVVLCELLRERTLQ